MEVENYYLFDMIGCGSYGQVYKAKQKGTNRIIAVKLIKKKTNPSERERKEQKTFLKECNIHSLLSHPNIIHMLRSFETIEHIVVVTELAGIDLHQFMKHNKLSEKHVQKLNGNLVSALYYLHSSRVSHRDLKPQNILLNNYQNIDNMEAKLCDFGLARKMKSETYLLTSVKGTPLYMAPEMLNEGLYDERVDFWSLGCVIYEANFGKPPIQTTSIKQLMEWYQKPNIMYHKPISEESKSFLDGLLKTEPGMRLTWPQIVEHPYVKDYLFIVDEINSERPLTKDLTTSQQIRKEKQRDEIILNRGKKAIADAMSKCQQTKAKLNQQKPYTGPPARRKLSNIIGDNESISSDDSISAIVQTDLETDVEGPIIKTETKPPVKPEAIDYARNQNQNLIIKRYTENFAAVGEVAGEREEKDNANLKIGTMLENMEKMHFEDESKWCATKDKHQNNPSHPVESENQNVNPKELSINQTKSNTELEKRKLSQHLENFSIQLSTERNDEINKDSSKKKAQCKSGPGCLDIKQENYEDEQSPPFENEEWLAFIHMTMQEVLNGEIDSLKQQNLVNMIVAILRNLNASSTVIGGVVQLLSIPFVLPISSDDISQIKEVYVQTKLLPNLVFASKIVCMVKASNPSFSSTLSSSNFAALSSTQEQVIFKRMSDISMEQLKTLTNIYELVCYLIHLNANFLPQLCDSMYIIANELLRHLLSDVVYDLQGMQLVCAIVSILCFVLRETPENAELVETVIFHECVDVIGLLQNGNDLLRVRLCKLLRIIGRYSCSTLQKSWSKEFKQALEGLLDGGNTKVKDAAKDAIDELSKLSFYNI